MDDSNVLLISYPSGGFGNFFFHVLTEFSDNTFKVGNVPLEFSLTGNSHNTKKYTNIYFRDPDKYDLCIPDASKCTLILCDNGIVNDSYSKVRKTFPTAKILRVVISENVRPVLYQTCVVKAMKSDVLAENNLHVSKNWNDCQDLYAIRENFTLMYHNWNYGWEPVLDHNIINVDLESLIVNPVDTIIDIIHTIGGQVINDALLKELCNEWKNVNGQYFKVYNNWKNIDLALDRNTNLDISHITDPHEQGYINYRLEKKYSITIPVFDYKDWFSTTNDMLLAINNISNEKKSFNYK